MKSVRELMKENRKGTFIPVSDSSSGLTADLEESFVEEMLNNELLKKESSFQPQNSKIKNS